MSSILAAVREAMNAPADDDDLPEPGATGALAPQPKGKTMSTEPKPSAGISQADHDAAVAAAEKRGATVENGRIATALGADGVKGSATRMGAALDMAVKSPGMSGEDIAAFVTAHVADAAAPEASYDEQRLAAVNQAKPQGGDKPKGGSVSWDDFRAKRGGKN